VKRLLPILPLFVIAAAGAIALGLIAEKIYSSGANTLARSENWDATKTSLKRGVIGAIEYFHGSQALADERLNLAAWHGHQEIWRREPCTGISEIELRINLDWGSWVDILFDRTEDGFARGVRISVNDREKFPSFAYRVDPDGRFLDKSPLDPAGFKALEEIKVSIQCGDRQGTVFVDGVAVGLLPGQSPPSTEPTKVGLRGSLYGSNRGWVDDLKVVAATGGFRDDFSGRPPRRTIFLITGTICLVLLGLLVWKSSSPRIAGFSLFIILVMAALVGGAATLVAKNLAKRYPVSEEIEKAKEASLMLRHHQGILEEQQEAHLKDPKPGTRRVLLVGSSQTEGAGAKDDRTIDYYLQEALQKISPEFEVVNSAVGGFTSQQVLEVIDEWTVFEPEIVVINLGHNDASFLNSPVAAGAVLENFDKGLVEIIETYRKAGTKHFILIPEAVSPAATDHFSLDGGLTIRGVGERLGIPIIDMPQVLHDATENSFIWWDGVHLTSLGQQIFAETVAEQIRQQLSATEPQE